MQKASIMETDLHIRPLDASELDRAADILARAFLDDPFSAYVLPAEDDREDLLYWYYGTIVQYGLLHGAVHTTADTAGVAVWLPQDDTGANAAHLEEAGLLDAPDVLGMPAFGRLVGIMGCLNRVRHRLMHGPYWYLPAIGVDPAAQGRGVGSTLLRPMLARADAENRPCYLETFTEQNAHFYQRHGFVSLVDEIDGESGLHYWGLRRDPRRERATHDSDLSGRSQPILKRQ